MLYNPDLKLQRAVRIDKKYYFTIIHSRGGSARCEASVPTLNTVRYAPHRGWVRRLLENRLNRLDSVITRSAIFF